MIRTIHVYKNVSNLGAKKKYLYHARRYNKFFFSLLFRKKENLINKAMKFFNLFCWLSKNEGL